jgi:hypothetical protein
LLFLSQYIPDRAAVAYLAEGFMYGFDLGIKWDLSSSIIFSNQPPSSEAEHNFVWKDIMEEVGAGRVLGPLEQIDIPFSNFVSCPVRGEPKRDNGIPTEKFRRIVNLSKKFNGQSVNSSMDLEFVNMQFDKFDKAISILLKHGSGCFMAKVDLKQAYRFLPIRLDQLKFLIFQYRQKFFLDSRLVFGASSACRIFECVSSFLQHLFESLSAFSDMMHYLDDYFLAHLLPTICSKLLHVFLLICEILNIEVNPEKVIGPSQSLTLLGIILDSKLMQLRISSELLFCIKNSLDSILSLQQVPVSSLFSLCGHFSFAAKALKPTRLYLRNIFSFLNPFEDPSRLIILPPHIRDDLLFLSNSINNWNGICLIQKPVTNLSLSFSTDASNIGWGAVFKKEWTCGFPSPQIWLKYPIHVRELFGLVAAVYTWRQQLSNLNVTLCCDNMAVVAIISKLDTKCKPSLAILKFLHQTCLSFNIFIVPIWVSSAENSMADAISRNEIDSFLSNNPSANPHPTIFECRELESLLT